MTFSDWLKENNTYRAGTSTSPAPTKVSQHSITSGTSVSKPTFSQWLQQGGMERKAKPATASMKLQTDTTEAAKPTFSQWLKTGGTAKNWANQYSTDKRSQWSQITEDAHNAAVQQVQDAFAYKKAMTDTAKEEELLAGMNPTQKMYHINSGGFVDTETPWGEQVSHAITLIQIGGDEGYELTDKLLKQLNAQKSNVKTNDLIYEKELTEIQGYYNELITAKHADILSKATMNGTNRSVLKELQLLAQMDPGDEKDKRKEAVLQRMEALDISADDYALYTDDGNFNWDTFGKWAEASAGAGLASFYKGVAGTADLLLGRPLQAVGWENNPFTLANEYYDGLYGAYKFDQNLYAERLGGGADWQYGGDFIEGTVGALPQAIAAFATAGASAGSDLSTKAAYEAGNWLTKAGITVETMMKDPQYWLSFARTLGTDYEEAIEMGANEPVAALGATFSSLLNAGVEIGLDGASGIQGLPDDLLSGNKNAFWSWLDSGLEEGGEEWIQKGIKESVAKILYDHDLEFSDPLEYARDASIGTLSGLTLGGGQIGYYTARNTVNPAVQYIKSGDSFLQNGSKTEALTAFPNALDESHSLGYNKNNNQGGFVNDASTQGVQSLYRRDEATSYARETGTQATDGNRSGIQEVLGEAGAGSQEVYIRPHRGLNYTSALFTENDYVVPESGSSLYTVQDILQNHYGIKCSVVRASAWNRDAPAFSYKGQVYISENIDPDTLTTAVPHESTHVMKQRSFKPYTDFIGQTPALLKLQEKSAKRLINMAAEHRGIDVFDMNDTQFIGLYDELNAIVYGMHKAGIFENNQYSYGAWIPAAFSNFDGYIQELDRIHEQFRSQFGRMRGNSESAVAQYDEINPLADPEAQRQLLAFTDRASLTDGQQLALDVFKRRMGEIASLQAQLQEQQSILARKQANGVRPVDQNDTKNRIALLKTMLAREHNELLSMQSAPGLQQVMQKAKRVEKVSAESAEATAEALEFFKASSTDDLNAIIKRGTIKIQNGFSCFPDGDPLNENSQKVAPLSDYFDVAMHGTPTDVGFGTKNANMSARLLAAVIRHSEGYNGQKIRLLSCSTGEIVDGGICFAEELANALGVEVMAPNDELYIFNSGKLQIGKFGDGKFIVYKPNQRRRIK